MSNETSANLSRRAFLKTTAVTTGGLVIAFHFADVLPKAWAQAAATTAKVYPPNAFIRISPDNAVIVTVNKLEMGQGVYTSMAQLIAEELDCDWQNVVSMSAPVNPVYNHTFMPTQMTGGSSALASTYDQYRKIGAMARLMLVQAAAQKWGVSPSSCRTEKGYVIHDSKGKIAFGEVSDAANGLPLPKEVTLKDPKNFKIIGQSMPRLDAKVKSSGQAIYGLDVKVPGMQYVMVVRPPVFGATLAKFDGAPAKAIPGVLDVIKLSNGIAVLAKNTWAARRGRDAVKAEWNMNGKDQFDQETLMRDYKKMGQKPSIVVKDNPEALATVKKASHLLTAEYEFPFLAHAAMEPMNCTVHYDGRVAELWSGHQMPTVDRDVAAKVLGLPPEKVKVNTVYAGGSFGRRASKTADYVVEACEIAKLVKKPIKVVWSREDDMRGGYYRPMNYHLARIATDKHGYPEAWHHTMVGQSIMKASFFEAMMAGKPVDPVVVEGVAESRYKIPHFHIDLEMPSLDIPSLWWRSVGHSHTAFVMETLIDELAEKAKIDPLKFRRKLLEGNPRHLAVIDLLTKKVPWTKKLAKGHALGVAVHESFNSVVGHVTEVSIVDGRPKIHRVWSAVHCGRVVNPEGAKTQVEGAITFGLSAALYGEIKFTKGQVTTGNFNDYPVLRMNEMPQVEVHFVPSVDTPTGLGEPGLPPVAPAVANALHKLTGKRARRLPFQLA